MTTQPAGTALDYIFEDHTVRVVVIDGDPWFVASDVTSVLGYTNASKAVADHCRATIETRTNDSLGRQSKTNIIPERDVYRLIMRSKLPAATRFEDWVVGTVLPAIRKDGGYIQGEEKVPTGELEEAEFVLKAFTMLQQKCHRLAEERDKVQAHNDSLASTIGQHEHTLAVVARTLPGVNVNAIKSRLLKLGYLYNISTYRVYRRYFHLFTEKFNGSNGRIDIYVTQEGKALLTRLHAEGQLIMRKDCEHIPRAYNRG